MRSNILLLVIFAVVLSTGGEIQAQSLKRSVIATSGGSFSNAQFHVSSTCGQPPNPGTVQGSNEVYLRQGFQQPPALNNATDDNCGLIATFDIDSEQLGECGTYYSFIYTGSSDPDLVYSWDFGQGAMPPVSNEMNPSNIAYTNIGLKTIVLTITKDSCIETASRIIDVTDPGYGVLAISTDEQCFGDADASIELDIYNGLAPYQYSWNTGSTAERLTDLPAGNYSFTVTDANGCTFSGNENVTGPDTALIIEAYYKDESCIGTLDGEVSIEVSGGTGPYTINWSNGATTDLLTDLSAGVYTVTITDDNACVIDSTFELIVFCQDGDDGIPDVISPNGDGINDEWIIPGIENYPNNEVFIFNRWGGTVYTVKSYMNTWTGTTMNGDPLQIGAYFYLIQLNDEYGTEFSGSITIIR